MNERTTPPFATKVVDIKPRGSERVAHSQFGHFAPDEELINSTARIKNQRDLIMDRLEKMSSAQTRVSKTVFDKVRRDYALQLETINDLLVEKKHLLKEEIKKLYINREKLSFEINRHREILEEAEFRHFLGEFTQTQYQEVENFETREIEKLEVDLAHIAQWVRTHEELFDPEDFGQKRPEKQQTTQQPTAPHVESKFQDTVATPAEPAAKAATEETVTAYTQQPEIARFAPAAPVKQQEEPSRIQETSIPKTPEPITLKQESPTQVTSVAQAPEQAPSVVPAAKTSAPPAPAEVIQESQQSPSFADLQKTDINIPLSSDEISEEPIGLDISNPTAESVDEFSYLFEEDSSSSQGEDLSGAESNIKTLLDAASAPTHAQESAVKQPLELDLDEEESALFPEPEENDYFSQDKVSEASFRIAKQKEEDSVTASKESLTTPAKAPPPPPPAPAAVEVAARQVLQPNPEKPVSRDESISNILDSIQFDGDTGNAAESPNQKPAAVAAEASDGEFKLILTQGDLDDNTFAVRENTSIGRSPSNDVVLKEPKVSRQHAAINKYNEHYIIIDLKSSNGVYVNGVKVDECVLHAGDEISIGGYKFQFQQA